MGHQSIEGRRDTQDKHLCTHTLTSKDNLESSVKLTVMFMDCGRIRTTHSQGEHGNCEDRPQLGIQTHYKATALTAAPLWGLHKTVLSKLSTANMTLLQIILYNS